ncbi:hypothetical protein INS49_003661 [Diaporthe citri]|uniref:uncharacterized protein n=1 Tax=Diaporthe citri TaxID=83186 RepID=UPI001C81D66D|nr:uncharacterized protein INS49_003661 [Diaporthe citri]KAG6355697.1 hypothetical protein INS49_003661 [Diaporthe citri]
MSNTSLDLQLRPEADETGKIVSLAFTITIHGLSLQPGDILCNFGQEGVTREHPSWYPYYRPHDITTLFSDDDGPLDIHASDEGNDECIAERQTKGGVVSAWKVPVVEGSDIPKEGPGSVSELLLDQGGIIGVGKYFIPRFSLGNEVLIAIEWDLCHCPQGTRAVTSFGEGPQRVEFTGNSGSLLDCVFMAGPVKSNTIGSQSPTSQNKDTCGTYWFGELPANLDAVTSYAANIFPPVAEHFNDPSGSYRAFLRRIPKGFHGTAFQSSSVIEYDPSVKDEDDWDLVRLLNRTMVSTWARLDPEDDGTANEWFTDGLSLLYTVFLPFRFGQRGPDYFRATVNAFFSAYYTNPLVSRAPTAPQSEDPRGLSWYASSAKAYRAFVYMLKMDAFMRRAAVARGSDVLRPMDELMRELLGRRRGGERIKKEHWLRGVAHWLGEDEAERRFREMLDEGGKVNELDDMLSSFGAKFGPQPTEQEGLDFGFARESLDTGTVVGVEEHSRAWEAGLRDGDKILWYSRPDACEIHFEKKLRLSAERQGKKLDLEYWPRSREKVRCWQVLEGKYEPKQN